MEETDNPLTALANQIDFNIYTQTKALIQNDWDHDNLVSPFSRLYYVKSGSGIIITDEKQIYIEKNHLYLIPVGKRVSFKPNGNMEKIYIHFTITKPDGYDLLKNFKTVGIIKVDEDYIEKIYNYFNSVYISDQFLLATHIKNDVARFIEQYGITKEFFRDYSPTIKKAMEIIQQNLSINQKINTVSEQLFVSESFLSKQFKKEVGLTISEYIDQMIFYKAQILLAESDITIEQISRTFGFCDRFYFSKRFKKFFSETPVAYRKRLNHKNGY